MPADNAEDPGQTSRRVAQDPLLYTFFRQRLEREGSTACREGGRIYVRDSKASILKRQHF